MLLANGKRHTRTHAHKLSLSDAHTNDNSDHNTTVRKDICVVPKGRRGHRNQEYLPLDLIQTRSNNTQSLLLTAPMPLSSAARNLSPGPAMGSSHDLCRSRGMVSIIMCACCSRISRRSLASADCVRAARCMEPSGLRTTEEQKRGDGEQTRG